MPLAELLAAPAPPDARRARGNHPKGMEPGVRYEAGEPAEVTVQLVAIPPNEQAWREQISKVTGLVVPEHRQVVLTDVRYWGDPEDPYVYCRFRIVDRPKDRPDLDAVALLKRLRPRRPVKTATYTGDTTLCVSWNDWQVGKLAGGGTPALAERLDQAYDGVRVRARELRRIGRDLGHLVVLGGGDMIEGCAIFPNQVFEIDSDRRAQIRNAVTLGLDGLDRLAPLFERVTVLVVGGNHGENRIRGERTNRHDNDDNAVFEHMARAAARDPRLNHVEFVIAQSEPAKTLDVHGHILATTHGHVFGRGTGSIEQRAWRWYSQQAAGRQPAGDADVLVTHHFHHYAASDWGACLWVQTPAMDGGSDWLTDRTGQSGHPGMLTWVMSPEHRYTDHQIL